MKKIMICLTCLAALMAVIAAPSFAQGGLNDTMNANATMNNTNITTNITTDNVTANNVATNNVTTNNVATNNVATNNVATNNVATNNVATNNITKPELHVGYQNVTPVNNLDVYGTEPVYNIEKYSQNTLLLNTSNASSVQPIFNVSQRSGVPPTIVYTTGQTKSMYSVSQSPEQPVYNIEGYPTIKMGSPIP